MNQIELDGVTVMATNERPTGRITADRLQVRVDAGALDQIQRVASFKISVPHQLPEGYTLRGATRQSLSPHFEQVTLNYGSDASRNWFRLAQSPLSAFPAAQAGGHRTFQLIGTITRSVTIGGRPAAVAETQAAFGGREASMPVILWADGQQLLQVFSPLLEEATLLTIAGSVL